MGGEGGEGKEGKFPIVNDTFSTDMA